MKRSIEKLNLIHNNFYDYSKTDLNSGVFILIICPVHGEFSQRHSAHAQGQGCLECAKDKVRKTKEDFVKESNIIHNFKFTYVEDVNIFKSLKTYTTIVCPLHGEFRQTVQAHLTGRGCSKCRYMLNNKKFSDWIKYRPNNPGIFYILKCWNTSEIFYKIGITTKNSVNERYGKSRKTMMPYKYEILAEEKSFDKKYIWDKEIEYKKNLSKYHYIPQIKFNGSATECFKQIQYDF
jgi:hypothetical protein